jgi:cytochrome c-type biogenesis protein CcmE
MQMKNSSKKTTIMVICSGLVVVGAVGYMIVSSLSDGSALEYFLDVDKAVADPGKWKGRQLRLRGNVVKGTIQKKKASLDYRFAIFSKGKWVEVTYSGLVPDTFKDCAEIVVKGKLKTATEFEAHTLTAKCPSKYDKKQRLSGCGETLKPKILAARSAS